MITTTLARIREHSPCESSWRKLLAGLGKTKADDEPLPYSRIVEICGIDDALWATRAEPKHSAVWRLFACACAYRVVGLNDDPRGRAAIDTAVRHAEGTATDAELSAARPAWTASDAASAAASEAAWTAAWAAAEAAAEPAERSAERSAERTAERKWQSATFLDIVRGAA